MTPGQLSADGKWQWDGVKWVPAPAANALATPAMYPPSVLVRAAPTNSLAVVSLIFGILSWVLCPLIASIVAIVAGHGARSQIKTSGEGGGGMAMAGLVLGYVNLAIAGLFALFWLFVFGGLAVLGTIGASSSH